jgi:hypothetical protein
MRLAPAAALAITLLGVAPTTSEAQAAAPAAAPATTGGSYAFRLMDDDGDRSTGRVQWRGDWVRVEMDRERTRVARSESGRSRERVTGGRDYLLINTVTGTLFNVKPDDQRIEEMPVATFEGIIGKALGAVKVMVQMRVENAGILARELGAGGVVAGLPTQQYRIIEEFDVNIGVLGMSAERKHHRVETDYWVPSAAATMPRNPIAELVTRAPAALAAQDATHTRQLARTRTTMFRGSPVKIVTTVRSDGETEQRSEFEVTGVSAVVPGADVFALPDGFRRSRATMTSFSI